MLARSTFSAIVSNKEKKVESSVKIANGKS